jgi:hypothetical protein
MLPQAKIRTIDSFCGDILRANADRVGVPFNYRIADEAECELIGEAMKICRHCQIIQSGNFKIINFDKVTEAFMAAKATYAPLLDGELVLDSELFGKWMIAVKDGKCSVTRTDRAADVYVDGYKVYPFVFGPMSPFTVGVDLSRVSPEAKRLINSWFPVPLYCDNVS